MCTEHHTCLSESPPLEAPAAYSRRNVMKYGLGAGLGLLLASCGAGPALPFPAEAPGNTLETLAAFPVMAGCAAWSARAPKEAITLLGSRPTMVIVHHTATPNSADLSQSHAYSLARSIQLSHFGRGWSDSGQQFTITRGGYILEGRHRSIEAVQGGQQHVRGAHCEGFNDISVGIENEGTYGTSPPPAALYSQLVRLCAYICGQYGIPSTSIYGHRDFVNTACPGDALYAQLPGLRRDVALQLGEAARPWPTVRVGTPGEVAWTVQLLLRARGQNVGADGSFGPATEAAVRTFQSSVGIVSDGVVGPQTWERLVVTLRAGTGGDAVKALQRQLLEAGESLGVDGSFGPGTEAALRRFQAVSGVTVDGFAGPATWSALAVKT